MTIIQTAVIIVAAFGAWLTLFACGRGGVPGEVSGALAIFVALVIYTLGPVVLGG